ncbi:hypothetical protein CSA37_06525 [Candidatus Fermentibacteria bacterium]|nr:MAG: hypothetical protein CSA37_06525 [Candidatus Fermentibacteria bacterium]
MKVMRLVCSSCGSSLRGLESDCVFVCSVCGTGWVTGENGLEQVEVEHRSQADSLLPLPFWKIRTTVHILRRTVRNEFTVSILRYDSRYSPDAMPGKVRETPKSSDRRTLLFPAFYLNGLPGTGTMLSEKIDSLPPLLKPEDRFPVVCGCAISPDDTESLARCVAVGQETDKADWLAEIELVLASVEKTLVILPCKAQVEKVSIAETGVSFFRRNAPHWNRLMEFRSALS